MNSDTTEESYFISYIAPDEHIIWQGKPQKKAFYLKNVFHFLLPISVVWSVAGFFICQAFSNEETGELIISISSFIIFMLPVWLYLANLLSMFPRYRYSEYLLTNKKLYISQGIFRSEIQIRSIDEIAGIKTHISLVEKKCGVSSLYFSNALGVFDDNDVPGTEFVMECISDSTPLVQKIFALLE